MMTQMNAHLVRHILLTADHTCQCAAVGGGPATPMVDTFARKSAQPMSMGTANFVISFQDIERGVDEFGRLIKTIVIDPLIADATDVANKLAAAATSEVGHPDMPVLHSLVLYQASSNGYESL